MQKNITKDIFLICLLMTIVFCSCLPLFKNPTFINSNHDWLQMLSYYRADRQAILEHHQLPLRTHFFGGGYPLIANPQDGLLSPFFIPVLLLGEVAGIKINIFLAHLAAALGMFYLTRHVLRYPFLGALLSVFVFCLGGHMHRLLIRGQDYIPGFSFFFLPLLAALIIKARCDKRFFFAAALVVAIIAGQAGLYFLPIFLLLFLWVFFNGFCVKDGRLSFDTCAVKNFFAVLFCAFLFGAVKFLPCLELLLQNPRITSGYNPFWDLSWRVFYDTFFVRQLTFISEGSNWNYYYLGFVPAALCLLSFLSMWRRTKLYFFLLFFFVLLTFGAHRYLDIFRYLRLFPLFSSIEAPSRYFSGPMIFIVALCTGHAFFFFDRFKSGFVKAIPLLVTIFVAGDLFIVNGTRDVSFPLKPPQAVAQKGFFYVKNRIPSDEAVVQGVKEMQVRRSWEWARPTQYELMLQNIGKINSYVNIHLGEYAVPKYYINQDGEEAVDNYRYSLIPVPEYKGEIYFLENKDNEADFEYFSSNVIKARVRVHQPDTLIVNQNFDKYWYSDKGSIVNHQGLLAVRLGQRGAGTVTFSYVPTSFYLGLFISITSIIYFIIFMRRQLKGTDAN